MAGRETVGLMVGLKLRDRLPTPDFTNAAELRERVCMLPSIAPELVRNLFLAANGVTDYTKRVQDKQRNQKTDERQTEKSDKQRNRKTDERKRARNKEEREKRKEHMKKSQQRR